MQSLGFSITWLAILVLSIIVMCVIIHALFRLIVPNNDIHADVKMKVYVKGGKSFDQESKSGIVSKEEEKSTKCDDSLGNNTESQAGECLEETVIVHPQASLSQLAVVSNVVEQQDSVQGKG